MALIFSDNFETNNFSNWTGSNGSVATGTSYALAGTYGARCNSFDAFVYKDFTAPASKIVSFATKVKLVTATDSGIFRILQISQGTSWIARIIYNNGNYYLLLRNSDTAEQSVQISGIVANTVQELRIDYDWNPGQLFTAKAYVDGILVGSLTNNGVGPTPWTADRIFILSYEDAVSTTADIYFDNVVVYDAIPSGTTYNQSVSITISSTVTKQSQVSKSTAISISNTLSLTKAITKTAAVSISNSLSITSNVFRLYLQTINVSISTVLSISSAAVETIIKGIRNVASLLIRQKDTTTIEVRLKDNDEL